LHSSVFTGLEQDCQLLAEVCAVTDILPCLESGHLGYQCRAAGQGDKIHQPLVVPLADLGHLHRSNRFQIVVDLALERRTVKAQNTVAHQGNADQQSNDHRDNGQARLAGSSRSTVGPGVYPFLQ